MTRRIVITGMGAISPNGLGKQAFCRAILDGKSGVKRISRFDSSDLPVHIAGEIPEFDELAWIDARERKHVSRVVPLCLAASTEALKDARIDWAGMSLEEKREIGIILGSGGGAQEFSEEMYRLWHSGNVRQVSLFCIPSYTMLRALTQSWNDAPERASRPFSADRDGFVVAEGSWMFVVEDYEHARARGARIYAEIAGYGSTCEAF